MIFETLLYLFTVAGGIELLEGPRRGPGGAAKELPPAHDAPPPEIARPPSEPSPLSLSGLLTPITPSSKAEERDEQAYKISGATLGVAVVSLAVPAVTPLVLGGVAYTGFPMMRDAITTLFKEGKVVNDLLSTISIGILWATGHHVVMALGSYLHYLSKRIVNRVRGQSKQILTDLVGQLPRTVWVVRDDVEVQTPLEQLRAGDVVAIHAGEMIPSDGTIIAGQALIEQHRLTGEFQPAEKGEGDSVLASTMVQSGNIRVRVDKTGQETTIAKLVQILAQVSTHKTAQQLKGEEWADRAAFPLLATAGAMFVVLGPIPATVVLKSGIGNTIKLLAPLGTLNYLTVASRRGILIKDGRALEAMSTIDTVLFDKTGTLTTDEMRVIRVHAREGTSERDVLRHAALAERKLSHPMARAIVSRAAEEQVDVPEVAEVQYQIGAGVRVEHEGQVIHVGGPQLMRRAGVDLSPAAEEIDGVYERGNTLALVAVDHELRGIIELGAEVRPEVPAMIAALRRHGVKRIAIVSGDMRQPVQRLADSLGIDGVYAEVLPGHKADIVDGLRQSGHMVCFVGDGVNDTIAMKKADVSISLGGASSIAVDVAQVVLMDGTLTHMAELFDIAGSLDKNLRRSLTITLVPTAFNLGAVLLFDGYGVLSSYVVKKIGLFAGLRNAMAPLRELERGQEPPGLEVRAEPRPLSPGGAGGAPPAH